MIYRANIEISANRGRAFTDAVPAATCRALRSEIFCPAASRFHIWQGGSTRTYMCTRFDDCAELFHFTGIIVLAVARTNAERRLVAVLGSNEDVRPSLHERCAVLASRTTIDEWHVHFMACGATQHAIMADLGAQLPC